MLLLTGLIFMASRAYAQNDPVIGLWYTEDHDSVVEIYSCDESAYCGRFYWLEDDSAAQPSLDDANKDPDKRKRPLCGMTFLGGFKPQGQGHYSDGWIYSPRHGSTFSAELSLLDEDRLELRGYMFFSFLGGSQVWTRASHTAKCHLLQ